MAFMTLRFVLPLRLLTSILLSTFAVSIVLPVDIFASNQGDIYEKWDKVKKLQLDAKFDEAISLLNEIIEEYSSSEDILRKAYNNLIHTCFQKRDEVMAYSKAREALERFPDLKADTVDFPPRLNETYDQLRREMYGAVTINKPDDCRVFLNEDFKGETPLHLDFVRVGELKLTVTKSGYHDYSGIIVVDPNGKHNFEISMERQRTKKWWLYRVGPAVLGLIAAGTIWALLPGDEEQPPPQPLPGPPDPPTN